MSQVDSVALWAGLLSSIVGITLSLVAIVFTWAVNQRSSQVNDAMIKSLQKIESTMEHQAEETTNLIRVAWEKLLGNVGESNVIESPVTDEATAEGAIEEIRDLLDETTPHPDTRH